MKRSGVILLAAAAALTLAAVIAFPSVFIGKHAKLIDMTVSDKALALALELSGSGSAEALSEGVYDAVIPSLYERGEQVFPEVTVENELNCFALGNMNVYTLGEEDCSSIVLYIHGGAWTFEIDPLHVTFCDKLASALSAEVYMPLYPLAPQNTYEDTYAAIFELYYRLAAQGKRIFVMGDSAGGNITLGLIHLIKENGAAMPNVIVCISPCVDMTFSNPEMEEIEKIDPSLRVYGCLACAKLWAAEKPLDDPLFSAVNADVSGYPKTMIFYGTSDILYPDGMKFYDKMEQAGIEVSFVRANGLFHVFPIYEIPERDAAIELIADFCK